MRVVFIGPDCGGKSTVAGLVGEHYKMSVRGNRKPKDDYALVASVLTDLSLIGKNYSSSFIRDQWYFPVDLIYQRTLTKRPSPLEDHELSLAEGYRDANVLFVYVTASPEVIRRRFLDRGDELWDLNQIYLVAEAYEKFFLTNTTLHMIRVDTSTWNPDEVATKVIQNIDGFVNQINGGKTID